MIDEGVHERLHHDQCKDASMHKLIMVITAEKQLGEPTLNMCQSIAYAEFL